MLIGANSVYSHQKLTFPCCGQNHAILRPFAALVGVGSRGTHLPLS